MNDNRPTVLRSLGVGALIGAGITALVWSLAGCGATRYSTSPNSAIVPPMPRTNAVILAVESQRSMAALVPPSTNVTLTIQPAAPVTIAAAGPVVKRGRLSLAWSASPDASVTGYRLYYGTNAGTHYASAMIGNVTSATLTGLDEGVRYFIVAKAYDAASVESVASNEASGVTPIYVSLAPQHWKVSAWGVLGKTNTLQVSTDLTNWTAIHEWVGNGNAAGVTHASGEKAWFRVAAR